MFWALRAPKQFRMTFRGVSEASQNVISLIAICLTNIMFWALRALELFRMTFRGVYEASKKMHFLITFCLKIEGFRLSMV